jgi:hypothetical protein
MTSASSKYSGTKSSGLKQAGGYCLTPQDIEKLKSVMEANAPAKKAGAGGFKSRDAWERKESRIVRAGNR